MDFRTNLLGGILSPVFDLAWSSSSKVYWLYLCSAIVIAVLVYLRTTDVTGVAELPSGTEMVMPGDNVSLVIELITPVAMEKGLRFAIREGGHTVGAGTIAEIVQ